jgi:hypothetical protein
MGGLCGTHKREEKYKHVIRKHEETRSRGSARYRSKDNIKIVIKEIERCDVGSNHLAQQTDQ